MDRRRVPLPLLIVGAVAVAVGVGVPVGMMSGSSDGAPPVTTVGDTTSRTGATTSVRRPVPLSVRPAPSPGPAAGPTGLTGAQADLWARMGRDGVLSSTCTGYPPGEQGFAGVVASIECELADPTMSEPIVYYRFDGDASLDAYIRARAAEVDVDGDCDSGDESVGSWGVGGVREGRLVCVENIKGGRTLFKLVFSSDRDDTVVVVQDESSSAVLEWAHVHASSQFSGN